MRPLPLLSVFDISNPLTTYALIKTILFQVGLLGSGTLIVFLWIVPHIAKYQGVHPIMEDERMTIRKNPVLRLIYGKAKRWYDHVWYSLGSTALKTVAFFLLSLTLFVYLTDIGWLKAWNTHDINWTMFFLMARASGQPNGSHLVSAIPPILVGVYVAYKFRKAAPGNLYLGDVYQGLLIVGFILAIHESIWLVFYELHYAQYLNLGLVSNLIEDICFGIASLMVIYGFWKYKFRTIKMSTFEIPIMAYTLFCAGWWWIGMPVTTLNNYQIGKGVFMVTEYWADPLVNGIEIISWVILAGMFFLAIKYGKPEIIRR